MAFPTGTPTQPYKLNTVWLQNLINWYTGGGAGSSGTYQDLNQLFNQTGIQPVVMATTSTNPLHVQIPSSTPLPITNTANQLVVTQGTTAGAALDWRAGTVKAAYVTNQASGSTIYTVTTGKTFYLTNVVLTDRSGALNNVILKNNGTGFLEADVDNQLGNASTIINSDVPIAIITSGNALTFTSGGNISATVWGWEQ